MISGVADLRYCSPAPPYSAISSHRFDGSAVVSDFDRAEKGNKRVGAWAKYFSVRVSPTSTTTPVTTTIIPVASSGATIVVAAAVTPATALVLVMLPPFFAIQNHTVIELELMKCLFEDYRHQVYF